MVHYGRHDHDLLCGKCGSQKTQTIGRLEDGRTHIVRCNACGAHSTIVAAPSSAEPAAIAQ